VIHRLLGFFKPTAPATPKSAAAIAADDELAACLPGRRFSQGTRPVIRWIKGDGLDDAITRAAIGQATRLFGDSVDYCLCTQGINAARARAILAWADQPVEWWPVTEHDNPELAQILTAAGCPPEAYGYWWKWFPARVRPQAPEWILDGDMVITGRPDWFAAWTRGVDPVRVSQDDKSPPQALYGRHAERFRLRSKLYSGLISVPPGCLYMKAMTEVLARYPLQSGHDGRRDMCEQGIVAATFQELRAKPIPLHEFPFGRAFEDFIDYGLKGNRGKAWGYHFGHAFRRANPHFERLTAEGVVFSKNEFRVLDEFRWLGGFSQWGTPGWSMTDGCALFIRECAQAFAGQPILELGTSRGRMTAILASLGGTVTTVDHADRGASTNLAGLPVRVIRDEMTHFLANNGGTFPLIVVDVHGNSPADWARYREPLCQSLAPGGTLLIDNVNLHEIPEWRDETGVRWFINQLPADWRVEIYDQTLPGVAKITRP
jgi:predicted O-methyltransferase YrrM